jgi:F420-dependent oxidoreductase-like protein
MKLGLNLVDFDIAAGPAQLPSQLATIARLADGVGFKYLGVSDHLWQHPFYGGPERNLLECYTTLAYLYALTSRIKLTAFVTAAPFRSPGLLAKMVTTLDVLSGGRACLGIGVGYYQEEAQGLGIPFPTRKQRFELLEETVQICLRMWQGERGDERPFQGKYYQLERPLNLPQSLSRPHPPLIIAGDGEHKTLRLVARYADACNLFPSPQIGRKLEVLQTHCETEGRNYGDIEKTCMFRFDLGEDGKHVSQLIEQLRELAGMGIQTAIGLVEHLDQLAPLELIGQQIIPEVADL